MAETEASEKFCIVCGDPSIKKARGQYCAKHYSEYLKHLREGTAKEWRKSYRGSPFFDRIYVDRDKLRHAVSAFIEDCASLEGSNLTIPDWCEYVGCSVSRFRREIKAYCAEHGIKVDVQRAVNRNRSIRRNQKRRGATKDAKRMPFKGRNMEDVREMLIGVLQGKVMTKEAAGHFGVSPRTIARWIERLGLVDDLGYDRRIMGGDVEAGNFVYRDNHHGVVSHRG